MIYTYHYSSNMTSKIELILGCMFSGKTTELLRRLDTHKAAGNTTILVSPQRDTRTPNSVVTHSGITVPAYKLNNIGDMTPEFIKQYDVIGIDEGQFFEDISLIDEISIQNNKIIIITFLSQNYLLQSFPNLNIVVSLATNITHMRGVCASCKGSRSCYTRRKIQNNEPILIGGSDVYKPVCRICYYDALEEDEEEDNEFNENELGNKIAKNMVIS